MKLINQSVTLVTEKNPLKAIELAGRVSHKSEDKITDDSYKKFLIDMLGYGHTATLEFGDVYLEFDNLTEFCNYCDLNYNEIKYNKHPAFHFEFSNKIYTNLRWVFDNIPGLFCEIINDDLPDFIKSFIPKNNDPYKRYCFDIVCNRGVSHELVRHRNMSFLQESTRYCNYSKDKFSNELNIINPFNKFIETSEFNKFYYKACLEGHEAAYNDLTSKENGSPLIAQEARGILPNDLKTELYMTGFLKDWIGHNREIFSIDLFGETVDCKTIKGFDTLRRDASAHPQAREIAELIHNIIIPIIGEKSFNNIKETYYE